MMLGALVVLLGLPHHHQHHQALGHGAILSELESTISQEELKHGSQAEQLRPDRQVILEVHVGRT